MRQVKRGDFKFDLPPELIAQYPLPERAASRLMVLAGDGEIHDRQFADLPEFLRPGDLLVFNDTRVIPARLYARKASGGRVEILVERVLGEREFLAHSRASKAPKPGSELILEDGSVLRMLQRRGALFHYRLEGGKNLDTVLEAIGHMPLPPYIERPDQPLDQERYQTVYARHAGAVAAPTAGLHFDPDLLEKIDATGVERAFLTLHVGAGTFQPVRVENLAEHRMHAEWLDVPEATVDAVNRCRRRGGRVIAVGTTAVRSLETAAADGTLRPFRGESRLFITPGYNFRVVDAMITNFHLSESTLLMLVSAFSGWETIMRAYAHAITERYRFFSYGDAMLLLGRQ